jgi:hypothetical protein
MGRVDEFGDDMPVLEGVSGGEKDGVGGEVKDLADAKAAAEGVLDLLRRVRRRSLYGDADDSPRTLDFCLGEVDEEGC